jgi:hypothetical protein
MAKVFTGEEENAARYKNKEEMQLGWLVFVGSEKTQDCGFVVLVGVLEGYTI